MKWWKIFSALSDRLAAPSMRTFAECSPEVLLKGARQVVDSQTLTEVKMYTLSAQTASGGFVDKAGKADPYYTLFGVLVAESLDLHETFAPIRDFVIETMEQPSLSDVHLHCIAIIGSRLGIGMVNSEPFRSAVRQRIRLQMRQQKTYNAFLSLLTCYYIKDYWGLYAIRRQLSTLRLADKLPCSVLAALAVLHHSFHNPVGSLVERIFGYYDRHGGFRATLSSPVSDLLSTAVALYALRFAGADLRQIRPNSLGFVDTLYCDGGFSATHLDHGPDIEYTFYGLLALGALAETR